MLVRSSDLTPQRTSIYTHTLPPPKCGHRVGGGCVPDQICIDIFMKWLLPRGPLKGQKEIDKVHETGERGAEVGGESKGWGPRADKQDL